MTWIPLTSSAELDSLLAESAQQPVVLFKHSTTCSISATAKARLERQWDDVVGPSAKLYYLDLLRYRPVSNEVAKRLGVMHESPQLLLIQDGVCTYDASHLGIRLDSVRDKVKA
jgi:bacillithiol system protein YtxJ